MVSTISTNVKGLDYSSTPHLVKAGGYYYAFYIDNTDSYLKYRSSPDGVTWSAAANASHIVPAMIGWTVLFDGTNIIIAYSIVTDHYTRRGAPSGGSITWDAAVAYISSAGSFGYTTFCKTTNYIWLADTYYKTNYHLRVLRSADGTVWSTVLDQTGTTNFGSPHITSDEHEGTDRVLVIYTLFYETTLFYRIWDGSAWSGVSTFAEKTASQWSGYPCRDLWTANGEIHFVYVTATAGSAIRYRRYTNSWQDYVTIDANTDIEPTISNSGDKLRVFYRRYTLPTAIFYREMNYTTHAFGDEQTLISSLPTNFTIPASEKEVSVFYDLLGVTWREEVAVPYTYKFAALTIGSATPPAPSTVGPPSFYPWLKTRPVPREVLKVIVDYYKLKGNEAPGR